VAAAERRGSGLLGYMDGVGHAGGGVGHGGPSPGMFFVQNLRNMRVRSGPRVCGPVKRQRPGGLPGLWGVSPLRLRCGVKDSGVEKGSAGAVLLAIFWCRGLVSFVAS
jgi:hypothetical protein